MAKVELSKRERFVRKRIQHYDEVKYWKYRAEITSFRGGGGDSVALFIN